MQVEDVSKNDFSPFSRPQVRNSVQGATQRLIEQKKARKRAAHSFDSDGNDTVDIQLAGDFTDPQHNM